MGPNRLRFKGRKPIGEADGLESEDPPLTVNSARRVIRENSTFQFAGSCEAFALAGEQPMWIGARNFQENKQHFSRHGNPPFVVQPGLHREVEHPARTSGPLSPYKSWRISRTRWASRVFGFIVHDSSIARPWIGTSLPRGFGSMSMRQWTSAPRSTTLRISPIRQSHSSSLLFRGATGKQGGCAKDATNGRFTLASSLLIPFPGRDSIMAVVA